MSKKSRAVWAEPTGKPCYLRVRNFERYQNPRMKDQPLWVQLWTNMLLNFDFQRLPDATKWHFVGFILLAAQTGNRFPNNPEWLAEKIGALEPIDIDLLLKTRHLEGCKRLIPKDEAKAASKNGKNQQSSPEQSRSEENKTEQTKAHTDTEQSNNGVSGVCSRFSLQDCLRYVSYCQNKGQHIESPEGLAITLHRSGEADALIDVFLNPEKAPVPKQADPNCALCFGSGMMNPDGRGARKCDCRKETKP